MYWYRHLYCDKKCKKKLNRIKRILRDRIPHKGIYLISLRESGGLMDIIYSPQLLQKNYPTDSMRIVGLADSYDSACSLVTDIVSDSYGSGHGFNIREFMNERQE